MATFATRPFAVAALALLAACSDGMITRPEDAASAPPALEVLECTADVRAQSLRCGPAGPAPGVSANVILGGQGTLVRLASSGMTAVGDSLFTMNVTVQSLLGQPIGTTDGTTVHPDGIQVFFNSGPTVPGGGPGTVEVANQDGNGMFTGASQPFFRYVERLTTEQVSSSRTWRFRVSPGVTQFSFTVYVSAPVPHEGALATLDTDPRTVGAGAFHSCAITTGGSAYCWGAGYEGQLGRSMDLTTIPVAVEGGRLWRTVAAGSYHSCGLTVQNQGYCWGDNHEGQLGNRNVFISREPVLVDGGMNWMQMDAGGVHTCGVTTSYTAYCWGANEAGQLGSGDSINTRIPVPVHGGHKWVMVDAQLKNSCGITRGGAAYCWGENRYGALGTVSTASTARPVLVAGNHSWRSISVGHAFACGITSRGVAMCWGLDDKGQIGNGAAGASGTPVPVAGGLEWVRLAAGVGWACGITTGGRAYCWGSPGDGRRFDAPEAVSGDHLWKQLAVSNFHNCGISPDGVGRCWGFNFTGALGDGGMEDHQTPEAIAGGQAWAR